MKTVMCSGVECVEWGNGRLSLLITKSVGPRILQLKIDNGPNIFADLPELTVNCPGKGDFHFYGGHRLWHAPELDSRTYIPDDRPVDIQITENGIRLRQEKERDTGIIKEIEIRFVRETSIEVKHILKNEGVWPLTCAPWAITQFRPGGVAYLPQYREIVENNGTLPNRNLAIWPYTKINSKYIEFADDLIKVKASIEDSEALKLGFANRDGWLAYWLENQLFIKTAPYDPLNQYYDFNSSSECYCSASFIELETCGPISTIPLRGSLSHTEMWHLFNDIPTPNKREDIEGILKTS